jgi:hypothetical protein
MGFGGVEGDKTCDAPNDGDEAPITIPMKIRLAIDSTGSSVNSISARTNRTFASNITDRLVPHPAVRKRPLAGSSSYRPARVAIAKPLSPAME